MQNERIYFWINFKPISRNEKGYHTICVWNISETTSYLKNENELWILIENAKWYGWNW